MSEKQASQVLTSENAAEFYAQKLGLAPAEEQTAAVEVEEAPAEPEVQEVEGSDPEAKEEAKPQDERKQNPKLERRFSEITKQREEARKEAQREREAREALERQIEELKQQSQPKQATTVDEEPQPSQFADAFEYAKALAEYTADKRIEAMKQEEAAQKAALERQKVIDSWAHRVEEAKAELPDFDDMVASSSVVVSDAIRDTILESDVGPKILYHLAENEELAQKIAGMSERMAMREIGKLEARFEKSVKSEVAEPVARSKAPAPAKPIKATSGVADLPLDSDGKFYGSYAQWKAMRSQGKIR
jgi:hypothetical protein